MELLPWNKEPRSGSIIAGIDNTKKNQKILRVQGLLMEPLRGSPILLRFVAIIYATAPRLFLFDLLRIIQGIIEGGIRNRRAVPLLLALELSSLNLEPRSSSINNI